MVVKRTKIKTPEIHMPESREAAEKLVQEIAELQGSIVRIETTLNDEVNKLTTEAAERVTPINDAIALAFKQVQLFAEANRGEILKGKDKSTKFGAAVVGWRVNPRKVTVKGAPAVIEALKRLGFAEAVRTKEEVAKDVILNDWEKYQDVKGLSFSKTTNFFVTPNETQLERTVVVK